MEYSDKIRFLRKSAKLSQDDLAMLINIRRHTICDWETGRTEPNITNIKTLANAFNVSVNFLLDVEKEEYNRDLGFDRQKDYTSFIAKTILEKDLMSLISSCTDEQHKLIQKNILGTELFYKLMVLP